MKHILTFTALVFATLIFDSGLTCYGQVESVCGCADETDLNDETILSLTAPQGFKLGPVLFASYGTPVGDCDGLLGYGGCHSENSVEIIENLITENDSTISIYPNNNTFADPCSGTVKRLCVRIGLLQLGPLGCTDIESCNFNDQAVYDDGSCLSCDLFAERCLDGTVWDEELRGCVVASASDTDFDGCVGMTDLLDLLSVFGTCAEEELEEEPEVVEWSCGDPLEYQGYDYETVLIGDQCWFAENLQATSYANGDPLSVADNIEDWVGSLDGVYETYGNPIWGCQNLEFAPFDVCNPDSSLHYFGRLYNWYAVNDSRGLCPAGWDVPSDSAFAALEVLLDVPEDEVFSLGWRGIQAGKRLKSNSTDHYPWNGSNTTGLSLVPSGTVNSGFDTPFGGAGYDVVLWTSTSYAVSPPYAWFRGFNSTYDSIHRNAFYRHLGASVRCIQDSE